MTSPLFVWPIWMPRLSAKRSRYGMFLHYKYSGQKDYHQFTIEMTLIVIYGTAYPAWQN